MKGEGKTRCRGTFSRGRENEHGESNPCGSSSKQMGVLGFELTLHLSLLVFRRFHTVKDPVDPQIENTDICMRLYIKKYDLLYTIVLHTM